jgi:hypothetical protein
VNDVTATKTDARVLIDAPDGAAALALERRLAHLAPVSIAHDDQWLVEIEAVEDLSALEASVKSWLRELGTAETRMRVDGRDVRVCATNPEHRRGASNEHFIG